MRGAIDFLRADPRLAFYGLFMAFGSSFGQTFFISQFGGEIRRDFALSDAAFGTIYGLGTLLSAAVIVYTGGVIDRVDLRRALESALELTRAHVQDAGVELVHAPLEAPTWVRGGEVRLGQVFVNLITNAVDAMADAPEKRLEILVLEADEVTVSFRDTGPGIEMPDKVFDPFYTTKTQGPSAGMGLGLSISYGIVQSFGGQIRGSNYQGGALFTVTLERHTKDVAAA